MLLFRLEPARNCKTISRCGRNLSANSGYRSRQTEISCPSPMRSRQSSIASENLKASKVIILSHHRLTYARGATKTRSHSQPLPAIDWILPNVNYSPIDRNDKAHNQVPCDAAIALQFCKDIGGKCRLYFWARTYTRSNSARYWAAICSSKKMTTFSSFVRSALALKLYEPVMTIFSSIMMTLWCIWPGLPSL